MENVKFTPQGVTFEKEGKLFILPKNEGYEIALKLENILAKKGSFQQPAYIHGVVKLGCERAFEEFGQDYLDALTLVVQPIELPAPEKEATEKESVSKKVKKAEVE